MSTRGCVLASHYDGVAKIKMPDGAIINPTHYQAPHIESVNFSALGVCFFWCVLKREWLRFEARTV